MISYNRLMQLSSRCVCTASQEQEEGKPQIIERVLRYNKMAYYHVLALLGVTAAALISYGFQRSSVTLEMSITINGDPQTVFQFYRTPENLLKVHPDKIGIEVISTETNTGTGNEIIRFRNEHRFPIAAESAAALGLNYSFEAVYTVQPAKLVIGYRVVMPMLEGNGRWTFDSIEDGAATVLTEKGEYTTPLIISRFVVSQAKAAHEVMHQNTKRIIEGYNAKPQ